MSQISILTYVDRSETYPITKAITASSNCGTLCVILGDAFTEQMSYELPAVNIKIVTGSNVEYDFDVNLATNITKYSIPVINVPQNFNVVVTPLFDNSAIDAHNNDVENGNIEKFTTINSIVDSNDYSAYLWTEQTQLFPMTIYFDNANICAGGSSGGGGGGGGSDQASDIQYNNYASGLSATNVQDAIDELDESQSNITTTTLNVTLYASSWTNTAQYDISNANIKPDSIININTPSNITVDQYNAASDANIICVSQITGKVTLKAVKDVPTIDIPIVVTIQNIT